MGTLAARIWRCHRRGHAAKPAIFRTVTNENAVKAFADARLWGWSTWRTSVRYGERRLDGDYINPLTQCQPIPYGQSPKPRQHHRQVLVGHRRDADDHLHPDGGYRLDDYPADGRITIRHHQTTSHGMRAPTSHGSSPRWRPLYVSYVHDDGIVRSIETRRAVELSS